MKGRSKGKEYSCSTIWWMGTGKDYASLKREAEDRSMWKTRQ